MSKSAVMVFSINSVEGGWKWGLPKVSSYTYLGIDFACNGACQRECLIMVGKR